MIKRLLHIFFLLMLTSGLSMAKAICSHTSHAKHLLPLHSDSASVAFEAIDTNKVKKPNPDEDKKKIKEIAKAKRQAKPEKLSTVPTDTTTNKGKLIIKRQRRPDGLERPPEIPRRTNN
jgi:hypothetical protein